MYIIFYIYTHITYILYILHIYMYVYGGEYSPSVLLNAVAHLTEEQLPGARGSPPSFLFTHPISACQKQRVEISRTQGARKGRRWEAGSEAFGEEPLTTIQRMLRSQNKGRSFFPPSSQYHLLQNIGPPWLVCVSRTPLWFISRQHCLF